MAIYFQIVWRLGNVVPKNIAWKLAGLRTYLWGINFDYYCPLYLSYSRWTTKWNLAVLPFSFILQKTSARLQKLNIIQKLMFNQEVIALNAIRGRSLFRVDQHHGAKWKVTRKILNFGLKSQIKLKWVLSAVPRDIFLEWKSFERSKLYLGSTAILLDLVRVYCGFRAGKLRGYKTFIKTF